MEVAGAPKPRVLVIGSTGQLGRLMVMQSLSCNFPTYAFVRPSAHHSNAHLLHSFRSSGAILVEGDLEDYKTLIEAIKQVDIVISTVNFQSYIHELKILSAIQEVGNIQRFVLIDYVLVKDDMEVYGILRTLKGVRDKVRASLKSSRVPFTHIMTYGFASYYLASLGQLDSRSPPTQKVIILGNGDHKAFMVAEEDIAMYTLKAAVDPRTINKNVHLRLPKNHLSQNDMVNLWESKLGKSLEKVYESEEDLSKLLEGDSIASFINVLRYFTFAKGGHNTNLNEDLDHVSVVELYPNLEYVTASQYLDRFVK